MPFEINLPPRLDTCMLRCAGMETDAYHHRSTDVIIKDAPIPFEVKLPYYLSDSHLDISITMLARNKSTRLRIAAPTPAIERKIREFLNRYSVENDGEAVSEREHNELWKQISAILKREGLSYEALRYHKSRIPRRAIEALMELAKKVERHEIPSITDLFANSPVERKDREFVVRWLINVFENTPDPFERGQLSLRIWENVVPKVGEDLIKLIENPKLRGGSGLLMALASTKHPRAADVIASVLHEKHTAWSGVQALAKLKATQHVNAIRRCLRDPDSDVRRQAKKALAKLGFPLDTPPAPVHLVKGRAKVPKGLEEWSQNLDMEDVEPILKSLAKCLDSGFGKTEIAEVLGVLDQMHVEQTRALRFSVRANGKPDDLWIVIFMDDIDAPDLAIHAEPAVIKKLEKRVPLDK